MPRLGLSAATRALLPSPTAPETARQWQLGGSLYRKALSRLSAQCGHLGAVRSCIEGVGALRRPDMLAQAETAYRRALSVDPGAADAHLAARSCSEAPGQDRGSRRLLPARLRVWTRRMPYPLQELSGLGWSEDQMAGLRGVVGSSLPPPTTSAAGPLREQCWLRTDRVGGAAPTRAAGVVGGGKLDPTTPLNPAI